MKTQILLIALIAMASGCVGLDNSSAEANEPGFNELLEKGDKSTFIATYTSQYAYKVEAPDLAIHSKEGREMLSVDRRDVKFFEANKTRIKCFDNRGITCKHAEDDLYQEIPTVYLLQSINFSNITTKGHRQFENRSCKLFEMSVPQNNPISNAGYGDNLEMETCLDLEKGFPSYAQIKRYHGGVNETVFQMEMIGYSSNKSDDIELPMSVPTTNSAICRESTFQDEHLHVKEYFLDDKGYLNLEIKSKNNIYGPEIQQISLSKPLNTYSTLPTPSFRTRDLNYFRVGSGELVSADQCNTFDLSIRYTDSGETEILEREVQGLFKINESVKFGQ